MTTPRRTDSFPWQSLAEQRIRAAQEAGEFDNLPGFGQPIPGLDGPDDENWWIRDKLRREQLSLLPPGLQIRLDVERGLLRIRKMSDEREVRSELASLNELIRRAHFASSVGIPSTTPPLDIDAIVAEWRKTREQRE